jgi:hypothetical protein
VYNTCVRPILSILAIAACASKPAPQVVQKPVVAPPPAHEVDRELFPTAYPTLQLAERAESEPEREKLARTALVQLDEERSLGKSSADRDGAYERIRVRVRIALDTSLIARGRSIEVLADLVRPLACPAAPQRAAAACASLMAAVGVAFPNAVGKGKVQLLDEALVVDEATSTDVLTQLAKKAAERGGTVVQRMKISSKTRDVLKVGKSVVIKVDSKRTDLDGAIVWLAFEARAFKRVGATWETGATHVLFVEPVKLGSR